MTCERCGKEYNEALGKCPYCAQERQDPGDSVSNGMPSAPPAAPFAPVPPGPPVAPYPPPVGVPPKKKNRTLLIVAGVVSLVLIAILVYPASRKSTSRNEYQRYLDLGYRYLEQGNYEEAILAFNAAIEIQPRKGEPYVGLGDAYTGMEAFDDARDSYERALELSRFLAGAYLGLANAYLELGDIDAAMATLEEGLGITRNRDIDEWLDALKSMAGTASLQGTVSEYLFGGGSAPLPGARVRIYTAETGESRLLRAVTTDDDGTFELTDLAGGPVTLHVDAIGHIGLVTTEYLEDGIVNYTELYLLIPVIQGEETDDVYPNDVYPDVFHAVITNAIDGEGVSGAEVRLRQGWNNTDGRPAASGVIVADGYGNIYVQDLEVGYYTAEVRADGFVTSFHNVAVVPQGFYTEWSLPISPVLSEGETRIVLTWGEFPSDLDSHLYSDNFHVFFSNANYYQGDEHLVNLDWDETTGYGPETITIYRALDRDCTYYVHDFTNGGFSGNTQLSTSGATVRVYQADGLVATFHVPTGFTGDRWTVFTLTTDGRIIPENTVGMDDFYW